MYSMYGAPTAAISSRGRPTPTASCPCLAAIHSGVLPELPAQSTAAPAASSCPTTASRPAQQPAAAAPSPRRPQLCAVLCSRAAAMIAPAARGAFTVALRCCACVCACTAALGAPSTNPEQYVNVLGGSDSKYDLSHGNVMPDLTMPWGFNAWAPQSNDGKTHSEGEGWWFYSQDRRFFGIRCTHQPSPWIGDYGQLRFAGAITDPQHQDEWLFSAYDPAHSTWSPYYQNFTLLAWGSRTGYTTVEAAPTEHGVVINFNFPAFAKGDLANGWNQTRRIWVSLNGKKGQVNDASTDGGGLALLTGYTEDVGNGRGQDFKHHYHATVGGGVDGKSAVQPLSSGVEGGKWAWIDFDATDASTQKLVLRVATSLISPAQAQLNHRRVSRRVTDPGGLTQ
jgi:putative alpha-1,2-mannosidase